MPTLSWTHRTTTAQFDIAIVGGGIVGLATAHALIERGRRSVVVLEATQRLAPHQSSHNSGVIHSGLYYAPGSLKARSCVAGRDSLYRFCEREGIPHRQCGKLVLAKTETEIPVLDELERRGRANGLQGITRLAPDDIREIEPFAVGIAGLWVAETGVVDFAQVTRALARRFEEAGGKIWLGARVLGTGNLPSGLTVYTARGELGARTLINCAGLQADRVARACGVRPDVAIVPFRGDYYELVPDRRDLVRTLIYPVPHPTLPFLGVHLTRTIDGRVEAGPNAILSLHREGYGRFSISPRDALGMATYPGFWRLAKRWWRVGVDEFTRSLRPERFAAAVRALVPHIDGRDLRSGRSGVRAQAVDRQGRLLDDFHVLEDDRTIHVLNAPSPAATACLSIGASLAAMVEARLS